MCGLRKCAAVSHASRKPNKLHEMSDDQRQLFADLGLLFLRLSVGAFMIFGHGWGKLSGFEEIAPNFPDPLGLGSSSLSLGMAVFAEVFCPIAVMIGMGTRFAAIPLVFTMLIAAFVVHGGDPWSKKEFALLYAVPFLTLILTGPGRFSLDAWFAARR